MRHLICAVVAALLTAGAAVAQPAELTEAALRGLDEAGLRERLGAPMLARRDGAGAMWTYRLSGCVLYVFLRESGGEMRVSGLTAGPLHALGEQPDLDQCLARESGS